MPFTLNQVQLIGRAGTDATLHRMTDGTYVSRLRLYLPPREGGPPEGFQLVAWASVAQSLHARVRRNDRLLVRGRLRNRTFHRGGVTHLRTEIHLESFCHLAAPPDRRPENITS
ncbi:MAG: single-stranded DNA-binding protein [Bacteroidota bacterium]